MFGAGDGGLLDASRNFDDGCGDDGGDGDDADEEKPIGAYSEAKEHGRLQRRKDDSEHSVCLRLNPASQTSGDYTNSATLRVGSNENCGDMTYVEKSNLSAHRLQKDE